MHHTPPSVFHSTFSPSRRRSRKGRVGAEEAEGMAGQDGRVKKKNRQRPHGRGSSTRAAYGEDTIFSRIARQSGTAFWYTARQAQNVNKTAKRAAHPVTESAALARTRVRQFSIFPFTASPTCRNGLCTIALGVKTLGCAPSPFLHPRLHRCISGI